MYVGRDMEQLALLLRYIPDACAAMHVGNVVTIDARKIRMGLPKSGATGFLGLSNQTGVEPDEV